MHKLDDEWFVSLALEQADEAYRQNEVPVGAVLVDESGKILSKSFNIKETNHNPCGHAEILVIQQAARELSSWRLVGCTLYVTLEPCPMCLSACVQARIGRLVFGAYDKKGGALSLGYKLFKDSRLNHQFPVVGGVKHFDCSRILSRFFKEKRTFYSGKAIP